MIVGALKEHANDETRVAITPETAGQLAKKGLQVMLEQGAGTAAGFPDKAYEDKGTTLAPREKVLSEADVVLAVAVDAGLSYKAGAWVIGMMDPLSAPEIAKDLAQKQVVGFSMELLPRISRAQSMDVLSSMATIAGYKAVMLAASHLPKIFPMLMTAAGTLSPAKVFVMGAGVAGLQAIGSAKRLGAVVKANDVRSAVKEQVESLGGKFVEWKPEGSEDSEDTGGYAKELSEEQLKAQQAFIADVVVESDVVITTAAIPGRKAPILVGKETVERMAEGAVIVDLAAERGGNCELTKAGETVKHNGVTILGPKNLPATIPYHASQMYAKNLSTFLLHLVGKQLKDNPDAAPDYDREDEITKGTLVTEKGEVVHERLRDLLGMAPLAKPESPETVESKDEKEPSKEEK